MTALCACSHARRIHGPRGSGVGPCRACDCPSFNPKRELVVTEECFDLGDEDHVHVVEAVDPHGQTQYWVLGDDDAPVHGSRAARHEQPGPLPADIQERLQLVSRHARPLQPGRATCGARTKSGMPCRNLAGRCRWHHTEGRC